VPGFFFAGHFPCLPLTLKPRLSIIEGIASCCGRQRCKPYRRAWVEMEGPLRLASPLCDGAYEGIVARA